MTTTQQRKSTNAQQWLNAQPALLEEVYIRLESGEEKFTDAVLDHPSRLEALHKEAIVAAIRNDAPIGVAEELLIGLRDFSAEAVRLDRQDFVRFRLTALQGTTAVLKKRDVLIRERKKWI